MTKRILILSDSLALPRNIPEVCTYNETWPILLRKNGFDVHQVSIGGATSEDLLRQAPYHCSYNPEIVLIQVGIVDCAPRFMTKMELSLVRKLPFGHLIIRAINTKSVKKIRKIQYIPPKSFKKNIESIDLIFRNAHTIFIEILPVVAEYEKLLPGVRRNVEVYNEILKNSARKTININDIGRDGIMSDHHHLNALGHQYIFSRILNMIV